MVVQHGDSVQRSSYFVIYRDFTTRNVECGWPGTEQMPSRLVTSVSAMLHSFVVRWHNRPATPRLHTPAPPHGAQMLTPGVSRSANEETCRKILHGRTTSVITLWRELPIADAAPCTGRRLGSRACTVMRSHVGHVVLFHISGDQSCMGVLYRGLPMQAVAVRASR
jgi:hypothetical protein